MFNKFTSQNVSSLLVICDCSLKQTLKLSNSTILAPEGIKITIIIIIIILYITTTQLPSTVILLDQGHVVLEAD